MDDDRPVEDGEVDADEHAAPRPVDRFRKTAVGTVVTAGLLGLRDALEGRPEREEIAIVSEAPDRPVGDNGMWLVIDDETKTVKVVLTRPPEPDASE
jgi:hypothetical protein